MDLLLWLENTSIAQAISASVWMYPTFESLHYVGLALLLGGIMLIDLRLLGYARSLPLRTMITLLPWVWVGFLVNVITGTLMFVYGASSFGTNRAFQIKLVLMALAGINALLFTIAASRSGQDWVSTGQTPITVRVIATLSMVFWLGVMTAGRWMAYV
ncbi:MAG: hypothetical protein JXB36_11320 [Gammaproteobacteria bacterium]|nr:hypothetical protein [Gammaproteobacteria bacterium]